MERCERCGREFGPEETECPCSLEFQKLLEACIRAAQDKVDGLQAEYKKLTGITYKYFR